ncbi:hypothetical protein, partial [Brevundimonas diminuta]|uniref:hypothetical protein n=1 Tax=Brevundimonas diminuta TaxID=293 RepID=UPI001C4FAEEA
TVSEARRASPSPSEAAIYEALFELASAFSQKVQESQRTRVSRAPLAAPLAYARGFVCSTTSAGRAKFSPHKNGEWANSVA